MVEKPKNGDQAGSADEEIIRGIFAGSRSDLAKASAQQRDVTTLRARHNAGFADFVILLLRSGKTALGVLGLLLRSGEKPGSREE
jgi:hypothetical protein